MKKATVLVLTSIGLIAGCSQPKTEQAALAQQSEFINFTVQECKRYLGGIDGIGRYKEAARTLKNEAISKGATESDFSSAYNKIALGWSVSVGMADKDMTCSNFVDDSYELVASTEKG